MKTITAQVIVLGFCALLTTSSAMLSSVDTITRQYCTTPKHVTIEPNAQALIGGVLDIRSPGKDGYGCGNLTTTNMQVYEAIRWALKTINEDSGAYSDSYIPGVKLGMMVRDSCSSPRIAGAAVADFYSQVHTFPQQCFTNSSQFVLGLIGTDSTTTTIGLADAGSIAEVSQISVGATGNSAGDAKKYPYLLRTVPADDMEAKVLLQLMKEISWSQVNLVYTNDQYGQDGLKALRKMANQYGICIQSTLSLPPKGASQQLLIDTLTRLGQSQVTGVLFFGTKSVARSLMDAAVTVTEANRLQWLFSGAVGNDAAFVQGNTYIRGMLSVNPVIRHIAEFEDHWVKLDENNPPVDNPWYREWYMATNGCRLSGVNTPPYNTYPQCLPEPESGKRQVFSQSKNVEPAVLAVFTYAQALKTAISRLCGAGARTICDSVKNLSPATFHSEYLQKTDFTFTNEERVPTLASNLVEPYRAARRVRFDGRGDLANSGFEIWSYNNRGGSYQFHRVGTYLDNTLTISMGQIMMYDRTTSAALNRPANSSCPQTGCMQCLTSDTATDSHVYLPGEITIGGLFSVHTFGSKSTPCGMINTYEGAEWAQAFLYALNKANTSILPNVKLGGLIMDDCASSTRTTNLLANFMTGVTDVLDNDGKIIDSNSVHSYIAASGSSNTIAATELLNPVPVVGYAATNTELSDTMKFPSFLRTVPSDDKQAKTIALLLKRLGWTYVQGVHSADDYGRKGFEHLQNYATKYGICIAKAYEMGMSGSYTDLVNKLADRSNATVVVIFADIPKIKALLNTIKAGGNAHKFQFVASEAWGSSADIINELIDVAHGSITFKLKSPALSSFTSHLNSLSPTTYTKNPWLTEWYESVYKCYIDPSNPRGYATQCTDSNAPIIKAGHVLSSYSYYVINAVYAVATGLHKTLEYYCGTGYTSVCGAYMASQDKYSRLYNFMKSSTFTDENGKTVRFDGNESGDGYDILNVQGTSYIQVGDYKIPSDEFTLDTSKLQFRSTTTPTSMCSTRCSDCLYMYRDQEFMHVPGDLLIGGAFNVHNEGEMAFGCGDIRKDNGFLYTEAFRFAIENINGGNAPVQLNGVKLGGLALDVCNGDLRTSNLVSSVHSGAWQPRKNETSIDVGDITGWITYSTSQTQVAGEILKEISLPQISPVTPMVDIDSHDNLYITVPDYETQADALMKLAAYMGWKNVAVIHQQSTHVKNSVQQLKDKAGDNNVCILSAYELNTDGSAQELLQLVEGSPTSVVILFGDFNTIKTVADARRALGNPAKRQILIATDIWGNSRSIVNGLGTAVDDTLTLKLDTPVLTEFDNYMATKIAGQYMENPWFLEYYENLFKCNVGNVRTYANDCFNVAGTPVTNHAAYQQDTTVMSTVDAVYSVAKALDGVLRDLCGASYTGTCDTFNNNPNVQKLIMEKLKTVSYTNKDGKQFSFQNRVANRGYSILRYRNQQYQQVGKYSGGILEITDANLRNAYSGVEAGCGTSCITCTRKPADEKINFVSSGDVLLAGIFDVHKRGSSPFNCGQINTEEGFQLLEAFNYAIEEVNKKEGIFNGKLRGLNIGGLGLDACMSSIRAGNLISNIHSGVMPLSGMGGMINPERIEVYIGAFNSDMSLEMADKLDILGIPQISYGSSSLELKKYENFLRTVPADDRQARTIVSFLRRFRIQYVQVVNAPGSYGENAAREFVALATENDICVAQNFTMTAGPDGMVTQDSADATVQGLMKQLNATVVVVFAYAPDVNQFLKAVDKTAGTQNMRFIGSESWADKVEATKGVEHVAGNSVTLKVETADLTGLDKYLESKTPTNYKRNPWFNEFYQELFQCSLTSDTSVYGKTCTYPYLGIPRTSNYRQDPYALYTVNAVYSAALGIHFALEEKCGTNYNGLCEAFRNAGDRREAVLRGIKKATFEDATRQLFKFDQAQVESNRGYHIYHFVNSMGTYDYKHIGSYNDTHLLKLDTQFRINWDSTCSKPGACSECPGIGKRWTRYAHIPSPENLNIVGFFDVHSQSETDSTQCGPLNTHTGFQDAAAFFYAIATVNKNEGLVLRNNIKLGGVAIDTCSNSRRTSQDIFGLISGEGLCKKGNQMIQPSSIVAYLTMGTNHSEAALQMTSSRGLTTISPSAGAVILNGRPYFLRIAPPNNVQGSAMADIARVMNWNYIAVIQSSSSKNKDETQAFLKATLSSGNKKRVCVGKTSGLPDDADLDDAKAVLSDLARQSSINVIALFTNEKDTKLLLQAAKELGLENRFVWLGSNWNDVQSLAKGYENIVNGAIVINGETHAMQDFKKYIAGLNLNNYGNIPKDWFEEYWQTMLQCRLDNSTRPMMQYTRLCTDQMRITEDMITIKPSVFYTVIATYMVAKGLENLQQCKSAASVSTCLAQMQDRNKILFDSIKGAQWNFVSSGPNANSLVFKFSSEGYGDIAYNVNNLQFDPNTNSLNVVRLGSWNQAVNINPQDYKRGSLGNPTSQCPAGTTCTCVDPDGTDGNGGSGGGGGQVTQEPVNPVANTWDINSNFTIAWGIIVCILTVIGIIVTIILFVYLLIFYPVKGGTTILGYLLLFGVLLMYAMVFAFVVLPEYNVCGIRRFCFGTVYALCFACMLVKVLNTWRVETYTEELIPATYERLTHPVSLFFMAVALMLVQAIIGIEWLVLRPPHAELVSDIPRCVPSDFHNQEMLLSCIYVMVLIVLTLCFAIVTWDSEENHRESRWILITCCFTVGIWIVFGIVSTMTELRFRDPAAAIALLVNATVILMCIYIRKVYLLRKYQSEVDEDRKSRLSEELKENGTYPTIVYEARGPRDSSQNGSGVVYLYEPGDVEY